MSDVGELQQMLDRAGFVVTYHQKGIYCQRHLAYQKMLIVGFARSGYLGVDITFHTV